MTVRNVSQMPVRVCGVTLRPFSLAVFDDAAWTGWLKTSQANRALLRDRLKVLDPPASEKPGIVELPPEKEPEKEPEPEKPAPKKTQSRKRSPARGSRRKPSGRAK